MPKFWKAKTILAKTETVYATDANPTGAADAILASDVTFNPMEGDVVKRTVERGFFGAQPFAIPATRSSLTLSVELVGSGTAGTAPAWSPLIRACGVAEVVTAGSKVEYTPITTGQESASIYFDVDGTKHVMLGARGNLTVKVDANGIPVATFTFTSLFTIPTEAARPTPDYSKWQAPQAASSTNTPLFSIGGTPFPLRSFEFDLANDVQPRMLIGSESVLITGRDDAALKVQVEATPLTTYDPFTVAKDGEEQAVVLQHGTVVGRKVQIDLPVCLQQTPSYQDQDNILEWQLTFTPQPVVGNDDWKITLT
ncbi:MAG: hypothetical protein KGJ57_18180 [Sphingomonadales bacterium]|nr:hypothetical protein [Sphingomonadales bacterium]MDE2171327.1 hypothetical protein [Sphingomonadales bacterium]